MREYLIRHKPYLSVVVVIIIAALGIIFEQSITEALSKGIYIMASHHH